MDGLPKGKTIEATLNWQQKNNKKKVNIETN